MRAGRLPGGVPAIEKQREKRRIKDAKSFGEFGEKWLTNATMADSTRAMRRSIFERELMPVWRNRLLTEITPDDLRAHCGKIVERGRSCHRDPREGYPEANLRLCQAERGTVATVIRPYLEALTANG